MEIEKLDWKKARKKIYPTHLKLAAIIDELDPPGDYFFYRINYPYGSMILDKGNFQIPNDEKKLVPLQHSTIPNQIKADLNYSSTIPMGLITENSIESFFIANDRIIPAALFGKGKIVSLWRMMEEGVSYHVGPFWNISSGARTISMLPKITDKNCYQLLKLKYGLKKSIPRTLFEHWDIFTYLANQKNFSQPWNSQVIFFSKKWFDHKHDRKWSEFYRFLLNDVWQSSAFRRNQFIFDFAFSLVQENRNLKPNPYLADIVKHLVAIGSGAIPAIAPATDDTAAPVKGIQQLFLEDYGLKKYAPIIMHLHHFAEEEERPVYYSLQMPTTTIFSPKSNRAASAISDLREVKHIMEILLSEILKGNLEIDKTPLFRLAQEIRYDFYHIENDEMHEIRQAVDLINIDSSFTKSIVDSNKYLFPEFAPFLRGCISISSNT